MSDVPRGLIPDDPDDVEIVHYKAVAEWLYLNDTTAEDRDVMHEMAEMYLEDYQYTHDLSDFEEHQVFWHGFEYACRSLGWFLSQDCEHDTEHLMEHFARAMRYSAVILLGMADDLPSVESGDDVDDH